jgi:hypothetical protein
MKLAVNVARIYGHRPTGMQSAEHTLPDRNHVRASVPSLASVPTVSHTDPLRDGELHREDSTDPQLEDRTSGVASDSVFKIRETSPAEPSEVTRRSSRRRQPRERAREYALSKRHRR